MTMANLEVIRASFRTLKNPWLLFADRLGWRSGTYEVKTRNGARVEIRANTSDRYSVLEIAVRGDYFVTDAIVPGATVVDIGANIGVFTVIAGHLVGPTGRVIAIEPNPKTADQLERNIALNGLTNVSVHRKAVTGVPGTVMLHTGEKSIFSALVGVDGRALTGATLPVVGERLGDILAGENIDKVDLIKIDCEGGEYEIFDTAGPELWAKLPCIVMETHRLNSRGPEELQARLRAAHYSIRSKNEMLCATRMS